MYIKHCYYIVLISLTSIKSRYKVSFFLERLTPRIPLGLAALLVAIVVVVSWVIELSLSLASETKYPFLYARGIPSPYNYF